MILAYSKLAYTKPFIPLHSVAFHKSIWPQSQYKRPIEIDTQANSKPIPRDSVSQYKRPIGIDTQAKMICTSLSNIPTRSYPLPPKQGLLALTLKYKSIHRSSVFPLCFLFLARKTERTGISRCASPASL